MIDFVQWKNLFTMLFGSASVLSLLKIAQVGLGLSICRGECGRCVDGWMGLSFLTGQPCSSMAKSDSGGSWRRSGSGAKCQSSCFTPANYACDSFVICPANKLQVDLIGRPFSRRKRFCRIPSRSPWDGRGPDDGWETLNYSTMWNLKHPFFRGCFYRIGWFHMFFFWFSANRTAAWDAPENGTAISEILSSFLGQILGPNFPRGRASELLPSRERSHIPPKMAFWVDDFPNFPFGGICIHSLEGSLWGRVANLPSSAPSWRPVLEVPMPPDGPPSKARPRWLRFAGGGDVFFVFFKWVQTKQNDTKIRTCEECTNLYPKLKLVCICKMLITMCLIPEVCLASVRTLWRSLLIRSVRPYETNPHVDFSEGMKSLDWNP